MFIINHDAEEKLTEVLEGLKGEAFGHYALLFHCSQLLEHYRSDYQIKIAVNIINDLFRGEEGGIFVCQNADIVVLYHGDNKPLIEKVIFQLRYLFVDDPLAYHDHDLENEAFASVFDLEFQWHDFFTYSLQSLRALNQKIDDDTPLLELGGKPYKRFTPAHLTKLIHSIEEVDLSRVIRRQPICAAIPDKEVRPLYNEIYINITHLRNLLMADVDLHSDKSLFKYLTLLLDKYMLNMLKQRPHIYFNQPISINLNTNSILSDHFIQFNEQLTDEMRALVIIEIPVGDIFLDITAYMTAQKMLKGLGYRICIDGLNTLSFPQLDKDILGFNLAKLRWNADLAPNLTSDRNRKLLQAIERFDPNRIILCWCDNKHALEYGHKLGLSLFQGRYLDKLVNPDAKLVN